MNTSEIIKKEDTYQLATYEKFPIAIVKGKGNYVFGSDGKKYLDFYSGHAVTLTGHCHPKIVAAISKQAKRLIFYSNIVYNDARAEAAELIIKVSPKGLSKVFFCNSGTEANETAMKIARKFTGKEEIISMKNSFHGRTMASLSATGIEKYRQFTPMLPGYKFAEFGNIESVKGLISKNTAAIIMEPIQSMAGVIMAQKDYYKKIGKLCRKNGILLIFDEVQTGFGRAGKMFACEHFGVTPDMITASKGLASGFPAGAVLINKKIADTIGIGEQGTTFGGGPLACAAIKANLQVILEEHLIENAARMGNHAKNKFEKLGNIEEVRGLGLLIGLKLSMPAKDAIKALLERGIITGSSADKNVIRLLPPLTVKKEEIDKATESLMGILGV